MARPRNIILLVADSLRYDTVHGGLVGLPYTEAHAVSYTQARAAGCWTLPATASMFTGLLPHQHGATAQTRAIRTDVPTLAEALGGAGYDGVQVTANMATTDVFGLHRGFREVRTIWGLVRARHSLVDQAMAVLGKPRLRKALFSRDLLMGKMAGDMRNTKVWLQHTHQDIFQQARGILRDNEARGVPSFLFLNLMEAHYPYHIAPDFRMSSPRWWQKLRELHALWHLGNQTWLRTGRLGYGEDLLPVLRQRQRRAWEDLSGPIDAFVQELHQDTGNLIVLCSDHGDNFGEQGWYYHFSNVTDAGNRVPLYWLDHQGRPPRTEPTPVSARDLYGAILDSIGHPKGDPRLLDAPQTSLPLMTSVWYNNHGQTLPRYRHNQLAFLDGGVRYRLREGRWASAPPQTDGAEPPFVDLPADVHPIEDAVADPGRRAQLRQILRDFEAFSATLAA